MENSELLQHAQVKSYINAVVKGLPTGTYGKQCIANEVLEKISALVNSCESSGLTRDEAVASALSELGSAATLNRQYRRSCATETSENERYDGSNRSGDRKKLLKIFIPCAVVLVAAIVLSILFPGPQEADLGVVFISNSAAPPRKAMTEEDAADIIAVINVSSQDINGDGDVVINYKFIDGNGEAYDSENKGRPELEDNYFVSLGVFAEESNVLFLCCPTMYNTYNKAEFFDFCEPLSGPLFDGTDFEGWYACVIDWTTVGKGSQAQVDAAMALIDVLNS